MTAFPSHNLDPQEIFDFFCVDFQSAWDALAGRPEAELTGRGNFMFARSAMGLLEFASRLCNADPQALDDFSAELEKIEPRYFAMLPAAGPPVGRRRGNVEFTLPHAKTSPPEQQLLSALFSLIRHGQSHQGQQTMATLNDGTTFSMSIDGVHDQTLDGLIAAGPSKMHLRVYALDSRVTWIVIEPRRLFLDIRTAIENAQLLNRGLTFDYLSPEYAFDSGELRAALAAGGLKNVNERP